MKSFKKFSLCLWIVSQRWFIFIVINQVGKFGSWNYFIKRIYNPIDLIFWRPPFRSWVSSHFCLIQSVCCWWFPEYFCHVYLITSIIHTFLFHIIFPLLSKGWRHITWNCLLYRIIVSVSDLLHQLFIIFSSFIQII